MKETVLYWICVRMANRLVFEREKVFIVSSSFVFFLGVFVFILLYFVSPVLVHGLFVVYFFLFCFSRSVVNVHFLFSLTLFSQSPRFFKDLNSLRSFLHVNFHPSHDSSIPPLRCSSFDVGLLISS
ncbi:hypothetical protein E1B28_002157 [Marasmius oreades]|uniref:Transmembrane protein n=1 Tax=Marasmius oreades TaxID=181124 RepID=A0A9P7UNP1_9AGAR|nr:uncharacterized protein E1B28_002157 [Marasmius oreades]KAG7086194.1 hypothetical protein E1B28_002157 [Marasmius oreades]